MNPKLKILITSLIGIVIIAAYVFYVFFMDGIRGKEAPFEDDINFSSPSSEAGAGSSPLSVAPAPVILEFNDVSRDTTERYIK